MKTYSEISHAENDMSPQAVLGMCLPTGQESRDMTVFIDDDARGYLIYSSEKNATTHIAELNDDYTACTGRYWRSMAAFNASRGTLEIAAFLRSEFSKMR